MQLNNKSKKKLIHILSNHLETFPDDKLASDLLVEINGVETWIEELKAGKHLLCMVGDDLNNLSLKLVIEYVDLPGDDYKFGVDDTYYIHAIPATIEDTKPYIVKRF